MTELKYDYTTQVNSSVIDKLFFNVKSSKVYVVFKNKTVVAYSDFVTDEWKDLIHASSKGAHYNAYIKGHFHSKILDSNVIFVSRLGKNADVVKPVVKTAGQPLATVTDINTGRNFTLSTSGSGTFPNTLASTGVNARVISTGESSDRKMRVVFKVDGSETVKNYNVKSPNVDDAVAQLKSATDALGLEVKIVEVVVFFE